MLNADSAGQLCFISFTVIVICSALRQKAATYIFKYNNSLKQQYTFGPTAKGGQTHVVTILAHLAATSSVFSLSTCGMP